MNAVWSPPELGEQVVVFLPGGNEFSGGVFLHGVFSESHPAPEKRETVTARVFKDGARIDYDTATHTLNAALPGGSTAHLTAETVTIDAKTVTVNASAATVKADTVKIDAPQTEISGKLTVQGLISANGDVTTAAGIFLGLHKHGNGNNGSPTTPPTP